MQTIELDNNYVVQVVENDDLCPEVDDIQLINWEDIKQKKKFNC